MNTTIYVRNVLDDWDLAHLVATGSAIGGLIVGAANLWHPDIIYQAWDAQDLSQEGGASHHQSPINIPGTATGSLLTAAVALLGDVRGDSGGEPLRGRNFWPFGTESTCTGNVWEQSFLTACQDFFDDLYGATLVTSDAIVLVSRVLNGVERDPAVSNTIASVTPRHEVAIQRNRRR
jgi:hypothetical protein